MLECRHDLRKALLTFARNRNQIQRGVLTQPPKRTAIPMHGVKKEE